MAEFRDETGARYGRLTVVERIKSRDTSGAWWRCRCDCGEYTETSVNKLRTGHTRSCGCLRHEEAANRTHGRSRRQDRTYKTWKEMRRRCNSPTARQYRWYGGRGISVCERWDDFQTFLADMGERPPATTLDRIDPDGHYEPGNCRWATAKQQAETNRGCFKPGMVPWNKKVLSSRH